MKKIYTKEELVAIAVKQEEEISAIRGYHSGLTAKQLSTFDAKTLTKCIKEDAKRFNLKNTL